MRSILFGVFFFQFAGMPIRLPFEISALGVSRYFIDLYIGINHAFLKNMHGV